MKHPTFKPDWNTSILRYVAGAVLAVGFFIPTSHAGQPQNITPGEMALSPAFCQDAQTFNGWSQYYRESPRTGFWVDQMGSTFWAIHHYCWAAINTRRAKAPGVEPRVRDHLFRTAIDDYQYVLKHANPDFPLTPEIHYLIGDLHVLLGEPANAVLAFNFSREAKIDYWPPYVAEAKVLESLNKRNEALAVIQNGLQIMPQEPALLEQLRRLERSGSARPRPQAAKPPAPSSAPVGAASASDRR